LADLSRSPQALDWRRRLADLDPTVENKLMLASTALRLQGPPYPLAKQTLDELAGPATNIAAYHALSAELAIKLRKPAEAAADFEQASRLDPTNELYQLNLAVLRLQSTNEAVASIARATLQRLQANTNIGPVALRWLVAECLRRDDLAGAERFSRQLLAGPHPAPGDRLQHLTVLRRSNSSEFNDYLSAVQKQVHTNAPEICALSAWMISQGFVDQALGWLTNCPSKVRTEQPVPLAITDCYVLKKEWGALDSFLQEQKWADGECLRFAFLSLAAAELKQDLAAEAHWRTAVREAGDRLGPLTALLGLASSWKREKAKEDLLWRIAQRFPSQRWALGELDRSYQASGNTRGLNKLYSTMADYDPRNFAAQNNWAATCLLLNLNLPRAHEVAKEVFAQHPGDAIIASTYAYSLHLQGRTQEGLAVFENLKTNALETRTVALYYGILLAAAGDTNKAGKYLGIAQQSDFLPEEKALVAEAMKQLRSGG
jgi:Flp pilus assembly protein TadD